MTKYTVYLTTSASLAIDVEVDDGLDAADAREAAIEAAIDKAPRSVCAQCAGWRKDYSLDLAEWDVEKDGAGREVAPERKG